MDTWTRESAGRAIHAFERLSGDEQDRLIAYCNAKFPPSVFECHVRRRQQALTNAKQSKEVLSGAVQKFPPIFTSESVAQDAGDLRTAAIVLTAGGDGERLKKSLLARGIPEKYLENFTKATFPLPGFVEGFGALQANLCLIAWISRRQKADIPVVITTGPAGSTTARVIPEIVRKNRRFGLNHIRIVEQEERLHLTMENKMAYTASGEEVRPVTHPDETGGPLMKLKQRDSSGQSVLEWLGSLGRTKIIVLQATGLYDPALLPTIAAAAKSRDCVGVGILREKFPASDPFGSYVMIKKGAESKMLIVEQEIRNETTMALKDESGRHFLPYNTGLYAFDGGLLAGSDLPDYATPPKEILPDLPRSPKVGYAATDIFGLAGNPGVLCIPPTSFAVIKTADDLGVVTALGRRFKIDRMCGDAV
jgi:hypothetical protein